MQMLMEEKCSCFKYATYLCSKKGQKREKEADVFCIQSAAKNSFIIDHYWASVLKAFVKNSLLWLKKKRQFLVI